MAHKAEIFIIISAKLSNRLTGWCRYYLALCSAYFLLIHTHSCDSTLTPQTPKIDYHVNYK